MELTTLTMPDDLKAKLRRLAIRQLLTNMVRQYGIDAVLGGLRQTYESQVWALGKHYAPVQRRMNILNEATRTLGMVNDAEKEST